MRYPILLLAWSCLIASAQNKFFVEPIGNIGIIREPATWTSPEAVLRDLLSDDDVVRRKALGDVGIPSGDPLDQVELRYVWMGEQRAAILLVPDGHDVYAAVAVPFKDSWKRIAVLVARALTTTGKSSMTLCRSRIRSAGTKN